MAPPGTADPPLDDAAALDALYGAAPAGLAHLDAELRYVRINAALAKMNGVRVEDHLGRTVREVLPHLADQVEPLLRTVLEGAEPVVDLEVVEPRPADEGGERVWRASYYPVVTPGGAVVGVGVVAEDVTDARAASRLRREHADAEQQALRGVRRLHALTSALAGALTEREVCEVLVRHAREATGLPRGWVSLLSEDGRTLELVAADGYDTASTREFAAIPATADLPGPASLRDRRPRFYADAAELAVEYPLLAASYLDAGNEAGAVVPIVEAHRLGFIALAGPEPRALDSAERAALVAVASQCAKALERARLYEVEHHVAETLQRGLLPRALPEIPGLDLAARFLPAGTTIGGDFYDALATGPAQWLLTMGDACGKGPGAAATASLVRFSMRGLAHADARPHHLLDAANRALFDGEPAPSLCSALALALDLRSDEPHLTLSLAGHPPLVRCDREGQVSELGACNTMLGAAAAKSYHATNWTLAAGDTLLLFTDGLTDAHAPSRLVTSQQLGATLAATRGAPIATVLDALCDTAGLADGGGRDDTALIVLRRAAATATRRGSASGRP